MSSATHPSPVRPKFWRDFTGPLTAELEQQPGNFGLGQVPVRLTPDATAKTICGFCSTGCSLTVHVKEGQALNLSPTIDYPVNLGLACPKGWEALTPLAAPDRATVPLLRSSPEGPFAEVDWDHALQVFTLKFKALLDQHGPDSVAWLGTGQIPSEELAFLGALAKFGMGFRHGDGNTRQCMATAATAYKQSFGFDAPPYTLADFEKSDVVVLIGSNLCVAHPIMWQRLLLNRNHPEIVVIDPRKTETAMAATQHLALRPKSDLVLLYGTAYALLEAGAVDRAFVEAHTTGFESFVEFVRPFHLDRVRAETGLERRAFERFVETIARGKAVSFWWTMGVNQSHEGTRAAQAIINLALMTGNIGRPGTGANSITGQCNAMGSRLFSNTTTLLGGHDFSNPTHRRRVADALRISEQCIPTTNSWAYDQIIEGIQEGRIKGLWIIATNSAHSWIGKSDLAKHLAKLDFLAVQDMFATTDTAQLAHLVLPAAGWGEKEGTFINSERRIGVIKKVARAPGQALADFHIFRLIAHYWGCDHLFREWTSPQAVFQLLKRCSAGQPCDFTGIADYRHLEAQGGIQWPFAASEPVPGPAPNAHGHTPDALDNFQERRLFADGRFFHPDGRARFIFENPRPLPESTDSEFPMILLTGRGTSAQWHTLTRTDKSDMLRRLSPRGLQVEMHPSDARRFGIQPATSVRIASRRGELVATVLVTATVQPGHLFLPMHHFTTNRLTLPAFDPYSRQPGYKYCAVRIEPTGSSR